MFFSRLSLEEIEQLEKVIVNLKQLAKPQNTQVSL
jgi:hypothetical protein